MHDEREQLTAIEQALAELDEARRAGVFGRTAVSASCLRDAPASRRPVPFFASWRHFGLPAVACMALMIGMGAYMFHREVTGIRGKLPGAACLVAGARPTTAFNLCFGGPGSGQMPRCNVYDCDTDGDVDLADFASYQVVMADHTSR